MNNSDTERLMSSESGDHAGDGVVVGGTAIEVGLPELR